ncbi:MAG: hypothetical protein AMXMBFR55_16330 [Gemmatimonadota bacterium]
MARRRRQFRAEFKVDAVRLAERGKAQHVVARPLGIRADLLRKWRRQIATAPSGQDAFRGNGKLTSQDEEVRQLRRKVAQLREERDILKNRLALVALPVARETRSGYRRRPERRGRLLIGVVRAR